eukprot:scaffold92943_cov72-Cyclotella_meneghiniana.AAC.6
MRGTCGLRVVGMLSIATDTKTLSSSDEAEVNCQRDSCGGMGQSGGPALSMAFLYGIELLPLVEKLKRVVPDT